MNINDPISVNAMLTGNLLEKMRFAYLSDPDAFVKAFANIGISINQANIMNELVTLNNLHAKGFDKNGSLKSNSGSTLIFDVNDIVDSIVPQKTSKIAIY